MADSIWRDYFPSYLRVLLFFVSCSLLATTPHPLASSMTGGTPTVEASAAPDVNGRTEAAAAVRPPRVGNFIGRHRLSAAIGRLDQEIQSLENLKNWTGWIHLLPHASMFFLPWKEFLMVCYPSQEAPRILHGRDGSNQFEARGTANGGTIETPIFLRKYCFVMLMLFMNSKLQNYNIVGSLYHSYAQK
ncbi:hypothetical protein HPP92_010415 [Vanilla planifolia]|uniref:Uncharacterized protein n=1 Tax=Vanilla planifolia TaxID=51239 RepID=A0A835UZ93_VANPL|nr:hypothetical protein HPP92_010415 [Vanilla planifolia]